MTLSGSSGAPLQMTLDIEGETEVVTNSAFPTPNNGPYDENPFIFCDAVITGGFPADTSATEMFEFSLVVENFLSADRFVNSCTRTNMVPLDRAISLNVTVPYTADEVDLYDQAVAGMTDTTFTITNADTANKVLTLKFSNLKTPAQSPVVGSRGSEITMSLPMICRIDTNDSGNDEMVTTLQVSA
jgi:hypothetical protein